MFTWDEINWASEMNGVFMVICDSRDDKWSEMIPLHDTSYVSHFLRYYRKALVNDDSVKAWVIIDCTRKVILAMSGAS